MTRISGSTPSQSEAHHLPSAADTALDLVTYQHDPVLIAEVPEGAQESIGRNDIPAFALDRLYEDRRYIVRSNLPGEEVINRVQRALHSRFGATQLVGIGEGDMVHLGQHGTEVGVLPRLARGEAHGAVGAAVERLLKGDEPGPSGMVAGQLDGRLDGFGARVGEKHPFLARTRRQLRQPLGQTENPSK